MTDDGKFYRKKGCILSFYVLCFSTIKYRAVRCQSNSVFLKLALVKRETGASPVRTRHRNKGAEADRSLGDREDGGCDDF